MAYGLKYILGMSQDLNLMYEVYLEYLGFVGVPTNIISAIDGLKIRSVSGDENKFTPLLGSECLLNIVVGSTNDKGIVTDDSTFTIYDLTATNDNDIRVTVYRDRDYTKSIWQGFVVVEDNSQPFLDPPFTLSIRALDGLGLLKNVDMVDATGALFAGNLSIEDWIGNILYKTGQTLNLRVYFPFFSALASETTPPLQQIFLNANTWQIGELTTSTDPSVDVFASEAVDAYTALQSICKSLRARLFQEDGVWNFVSLYSYADPGGMFYNESTGVLTSGIYHMNPVGTGTGLNYNVPVGSNDIIHPVSGDAMIYLKLATKWVKLNYTYDQSLNKICNQNFKQGAADTIHNGTISSTIEDPTILPAITFSYNAYFPFCWTIAGGTIIGGGVTPFPETAQTATSYIRDVQDIYNVSENRYLILSTATFANHARSTTFLIDKNDVLQISLDFRTNIDIGNNTINFLHILLDGDDGSKWGLGGFGGSGGDHNWILLDSNYMIGGGANFPPLNGIGYGGPGGLASKQWNSISIDKNNLNGINFVPVSGKCFLVLEGLPTSSGTAESWFKNINVTILPYLRGSFTQLKGDYNFFNSNSTIKQTDSEDVQISDSPKRYFKGALIQSNGNLIPPSWHRRGVTETKRFTQLMGQLVYNNLFRPLNKIEGKMRGLTWVDQNFNVRQAGYLNKYHFTNHPEPTKQFILTSFDKDYGTGQGRCVFVEILKDQNDSGWMEPDSYQFQYLFQ